MNAEARNWVRVGVVDDVPRRGARCVVAGAATIAVFRTEDDRIFAMEDRCPHRNGRLSQGIVHGGCVTCPLHNWVISLDTGRAQGADEGGATIYPVRVRDGEIFIDLTFGKSVR